MKKVLITVFALALAGFAFWFSSLNRNDVYGEIDIVLVNSIGETVLNETIEFEEDDSLFSVLNDNFTIACGDINYNISTECSSTFNGRVILKINDVESNWWENYLAIYIDDTYSNNGVDNIPLEDGKTYKFQYTEVGGND